MARRSPAASGTPAADGQWRIGRRNPGNQSHRHAPPAGAAKQAGRAFPSLHPGQRQPDRHDHRRSGSADHHRLDDLGTTGGISNTITYTQVGITLNVTPHINPEGLVILDVSPEVSEMTNSTVPIASGGTERAAPSTPPSSTIVPPTRGSASATGSTIVIGGMMQDQKQLTVSKVPLLGDIPWLGTLFSAHAGG